MCYFPALIILLWIIGPGVLIIFIRFCIAFISIFYKFIGQTLAIGAFLSAAGFTRLATAVKALIGRVVGTNS